MNFSLAKIAFFLVLISRVFLFSHQVFAAEIRAIEITSESFPGEFYYIGYVERDDHSIEKIFYENNEHQKNYYSFKDLSKDVSIIQTMANGKTIDLVKVKVLPSLNHQDFAIQLSYMRNALFKSWKSIKLRVAFQPSREIYEILDPETGSVVNRAFVKTNYWGTVAVGIDRIITSK